MHYKSIQRIQNMSQRKSTREERNSMLEDIALFKAVCAEMSWDFLDTPQKSNNSSHQKKAIQSQKKSSFANLSKTTTLQDKSFYEQKKNVIHFIEITQEQKRAIRKQKVQKSYKQLKQFYLLQKQQQRQEMGEDLDFKSSFLKKIQKQIPYFQQSKNRQIKIQEIEQNEFDLQEQLKQTKLSEEDEFILILKFLLGRKGESISWNILPITEQEGYIYIEKHYQHLKQLYSSKIDIYMKNTISLYLHPNKTISTMFFMLFEKYGMKFDISNQEPDFISQTVKKGMLGIEFVGVPYSKQRRDDQCEFL